MTDVEIRFDREDQDGVVAVGTYLMDAAKRFGVKTETDCVPAKGIHSCVVVVTKGAGNLSSLTRAETEHFALHGRRNNERLACEVRIERPGEIVVMTKEKAQEPKKKEKRNPLQDEFAGLPLEKKIANLMRMEAVTLSETFSYVVNSPMKVFEKVGDVIAEFGIKLENEARKAARPEEHKAETASAKATEAKQKPRGSRKTTAKKP